MEKAIPAHVSVIMDGNGRWARQRGLERIQGHLEGVKSVRACTEECVRLGVKYLSVFAFSEENWGRPAAEVQFLMKLLGKTMIEELSTLMDNGVRFVVVGNRARLAPSLLSAIEDLENKTAKNDVLTLIVFLSYSGKWDILQAARRLAAELAADPGRSVGEQDFAAYLSTAAFPDPDLLIRTSGEQRISNYMLWQTAYTEFYFTDVLWPDFREEHLRTALEEYARRDRRYGKVK